MKQLLQKDNRYTLLLLIGFVSIVFLVLASVFLASERLSKLGENSETKTELSYHFSSPANDILVYIVTMRTILFVGFGIILVFSGIIVYDANLNKKNRDELIVQKERAEKLAGAKQQFIANMSHEIKTPLHAIFGVIDQLSADQNLDQSQQMLIQKLTQSSRHLLKMVEDMLLLSQDHGKIISSIETEFDPEQVLKEVSLEIKEKAALKHLYYTVTSGLTKPYLLCGDPARLQQIVFNLLDNSIKFTGKGFVHLQYWMQELEVDKGMLHITIKDSGVGISNEQINVLFNEFEQGDASLTKQYPGVGIGLAATKKMVSSLGGTIEVNSKKEEFTQFAIKLPYQYHTKSENGPFKKEGDPLSVLVVDDDEFNVLLATAMLKNRNCNVKIATEGITASELLKVCDFDVILLDIHLPKISGVVVAETLRQSSFGKNKATPILAVTATMINDNILNKFNEAGIDDCLPKPYNEKQLWAKINALLEKNQSKKMSNLDN